MIANTVRFNMRNPFTPFLDMWTYPQPWSRYLELVQPLWSRDSIKARVVDLYDETRDSRTITLKPGRGYREHNPGQHIRVGVSIDGTLHTRTYSLSSAPHRRDGLITITVKAIPDGRVSRYLVRNLKKGDYLTIANPEGDFQLPTTVPVRPLFITGGSGITPIMSMLRFYTREFKVIPDIQHIHYAPHAYDVIFGKELDQISKRQSHYNLHKIFTQDPTDQNRSESHFSEKQLDTLCPDWRERDVWACGPSSLLEAVEFHWLKYDLESKLHTERFRAKVLDIPKNDITGGSIFFTKSSKSIDSDGKTNILLLAEEGGLNPKHGCRMGICHACDCKLVSGSVRDLRTGELITGTDEKIQICVSAAVGDIEVEL